jgi:hypothetical protein
VFAVAVGGTAAPFAPLLADSGNGRQVEAAAESTFPSEIGHSSEEAADEGTSSGPVHDPPEWSSADASAPWMPNTGDRVRAAPASAAVPAPVDPADAGPIAGGQEALLAAAMPGPAGPRAPLGPPPGGGAPRDGHGRSKKPLVGAAVALVVLAGAAAAGITFLSRPVSEGSPGGHSGPHAVAAPGSTAATRSASAHPTSSKGTTGTSRSGPVPAGSPGLPPAHSQAPQPPATAPAAPAPSSAPSGRADFAGTWSGTVSQPGWSVPSWDVQLDIPASGDGSYTSPSLGCSGTLILPDTAATTMGALAVTSSRPVNTGCTARARVTLTLSGPDGMSMTWTPVAHPRKVGTATLARS